MSIHELTESGKYASLVDGYAPHNRSYRSSVSDGSRGKTKSLLAPSIESVLESRLLETAKTNSPDMYFDIYTIAFDDQIDILAKFSLDLLILTNDSKLRSQYRIVLLVGDEEYQQPLNRFLLGGLKESGFRTAERHSRCERANFAKFANGLLNETLRIYTAPFLQVEAICRTLGLRATSASL